MKSDSSHLNKFRIRTGPLATTDEQGVNGAFIMVLDQKLPVQILSTKDSGWEHVSVAPLKAQRCLTWEEMSEIKALFWDDHELAIQYHPPKELYVNNHQHVLHLWRPVGIDVPIPPPQLVGIIGLTHQQLEQAARQIHRTLRKPKQFKNQKEA